MAIFHSFLLVHQAGYPAFAMLVQRSMPSWSENSFLEARRQKTVAIDVDGSVEQYGPEIALVRYI